MTSSPPLNSGKEIVSESQLSSHNREIDQNSVGIVEEINKSKDSAFQRKKSFEEDRDHFQKAAFAVLDMLNGRNLN